MRSTVSYLKSVRVLVVVSSNYNKPKPQEREDERRQNVVMCFIEHFVINACLGITSVGRKDNFAWMLNI